MFNKLLSVGLVGALSLGIMSTSVLAAEVDDGGKTLSNEVNVTINSGGLHLSTPTIKDFSDIVIKNDSEVRTTGFEGKMEVKDFRGTHEGWNIKASASQFERGTDQYKLPQGSLTLAPVNELEAVKNETKPEIKQDTKKIIDEGNQVLVVDAKAQKGMGVHNIGFKEDALELTVKSDSAKAGDYKSVLTWTLEAAPDVN